MKILCVGRNYAGHVREMERARTNAPAPAPSAPAAHPIWFWKPESAVIGDGDPILLPDGIGAVHHEVELAVRITRRCRRITAGEALRHLDAATVANDVTARDLQEAAKKGGTPWAQAKGHDTFLPLGAWKPLGDLDLQAVDLRLAVNGTMRQAGSTRQMTWTVADLLARASAWTTLEPGDVLLTGTPEGVGPLAAGDVVEAEAVGVARLRNPVHRDT